MTDAAAEKQADAAAPAPAPAAIENNVDYVDAFYQAVFEADWHEMLRITQAARYAARAAKPEDQAFTPLDCLYNLEALTWASENLEGCTDINDELYRAADELGDEVIEVVLDCALSSGDEKLIGQARAIHGLRFASRHMEDMAD